MTTSVVFVLGDLVHYTGPPVVFPAKWELIVSNNNGIINDDDIGVIVKLDAFLRIADVLFQENEVLLERISFSHLIHAISSP